MTVVAWGFDALLAIGLLWLAGQTLFGQHRFAAVVSFIAFSLLMSLAWVRLSAPDIALAEAAIGAGVTGALLLAALGWLPAGLESQNGLHVRTGLRRCRWLMLLGMTLLGTWLAWVAHQLPRPGLTDDVAIELHLTGVSHTITAVLLNLRAFDTLLEVAVMLTAVVLVWSLGPSRHPFAPATTLPGLPAMTRLLHPVFLLVPAYLLWRGSQGPGGAFPAGAVLGAGGVLLLLADAVPWMHLTERQPLLRRLLVAGLAMFLSVALLGLVLTGTFFAIPLVLAETLILIMEVATALSIALMLMAFYLYGEPGR